MIQERELVDCPDCGVAPGEPHEDGCDIPYCTVCGSQRLACHLLGDDCAGHDPRANVWEGEKDSKRECREFGWWSVFVPDNGHIPVPPGTPGASEDLNRWVEYNIARCRGWVKPPIELT